MGNEEVVDTAFKANALLFGAAAGGERGPEGTRVDPVPLGCACKMRWGQHYRFQRTGGLGRDRGSVGAVEERDGDRVAELGGLERHLSLQT